jgi:ketosteroid isomerase-like protein
MASANLDLVRSIFKEWERGDFSWPESADPEMEFVVADGPEPGSRTGLAARPWAEGFLNVWDSLRFEANEYRELDDGRVLVFYRIRGRGKGSGVEVDQSRAGLFHIDRGKVARVVFYWDPDRALADLGLAPEGNATD